MNPTLRVVLAVLAGVLFGGLVVAGVEAANGLIHAMPEGLDRSDPGAMRAFVAGLPALAFVLLLVGWLLGTFLGGALAVRMAGQRPALVAGIVGGVILAATVMNLVMLPHPIWVVIGAVVGIPAAAWLAGRTLPGPTA
ncbi:MAG: hypothetical protein WD771_05820 [Gemmatimonadaceae bacterium]